MTGGMAFIYDPKNNFENYVNPDSVIWQIPETKFWVQKLENTLKDFHSETGSNIAKIILDNFEKEIKNFKQVCPIEMLDKLENPISLKQKKNKSA